jgi:ABC-type lipoprotein release transport system permease subunit
LLTGVPTAVVLGRVMEARLFGVVRPDALGLATLSGAIVGVGLLAGLLPALRAAKLDPASILRAE